MSSGRDKVQTRVHACVRVETELTVHFELLLQIRLVLLVDIIDDHLRTTTLLFTSPNCKTKQMLEYLFNFWRQKLSYMFSYDKSDNNLLGFFLSFPTPQNVNCPPLHSHSRTFCLCRADRQIQRFL